jgi:hypothetical protein
MIILEGRIFRIWAAEGEFLRLPELDFRKG